MNVTLVGTGRINSITLPQKVSGQYWLYSPSGADMEKLIGIEGIRDEWILKSNSDVRILAPSGNTVKSIQLEELRIYVLQERGGEQMFVFTEPITEDRQRFRKYLVRGDMDLTIGRNGDNDIVFRNEFISSKHVTLSCHSGQWQIRDEGSTNGTFVNDIRTGQATLSVGDVVFMMGLKVIIGKNFIALNNPDGQVSVQTSKLQDYVKQTVTASGDEDEDYDQPGMAYFYRSPRFKRDIETATFKIDPPPQSPLTEETPWILVMGSSMAMGAMSVVTLASAIASSNFMSMAMGGSMLLGTMLLPSITRAYEKKRKVKKEAFRQKKYREYLASVMVKINEECQLQTEILHENIVTLQECEGRINHVGRNLWERGIGQDDTLRLRVGYGEGELDAEFSYSERKFSLHDDNLQEELYNLCESPKILKDIPITYSLFEDFISGVIGKRDGCVEFAKGLMIQIAALYSYDEVKLVVLYDEKEESQFHFVKWLPHVWTDDSKFRFIATNANEAKEVSAYLEKVIEARCAISESEMEDVSPCYVIFSMSRGLAAKAEMVKKILAEKKNIHFSMVTFYDELRYLPKECTMVVELDGEAGRLFDKNDMSGTSVSFQPDLRLSQDPMELGVKLSNIRLDNAAGGFALPHMITFLELFGVGKVEHLNALTRWKKNDPTKSLEAPVGVDTLGEIFKLDLHEKFHGPHGLVAGMTGSGKSEFIIAYILSLAVNYHPEEVAFVLIDYKGGGMAKSFEHLPHTAGIITNLDGSAIKRSLVSIESELKRRQSVFAEASRQVGESNIDIYKYQKLYREGTVAEPLPHLFIISDEFAELKTQQPDFMTQLVSAARIGRSLGIHLILATQKPSGVVDDQIWSNSKFRVCLKVQERADSMDMLKRPDAAELTDTGRFYLQVGYNELFELGQSAWAGAPYYPSDNVIVDKDNSVVVVDRNGHPLKQAKPELNQALYSNAGKQLDAITDYLEEIAREEGIRIRPLWLEPIPAVILLDQAREKYRESGTKPFVLNPVIGEYDDPARQQQHLLRMPLSEEGNAVVYGVAGSGKTSFLNAMIWSLIHEHTPEEVSLYLLDFASETLRAFAGAPHVGEVLLSYETEKISNLFKMLRGEAERRRKLFADYGGDYVSYIRDSGQALPSLVIVINNFAAFTENFEEKEEAVSFLSREGMKYGMYFVLTSIGTGGVRFRLLQNFKQMYVLQLNDESDYSMAIGKTEGLFPAKCKGRGLLRRDDLYEFQVAMLTEDAVPFSMIRKECERLRQAWDGECAAKVPILPEHVDAEFLSAYWNESRALHIPIGVEKNSLHTHCYPFGGNYITMVMSVGNEYQDFLAAFMDFVCGKHVFKTMIFDVPDSVGQERKPETTYVTGAECVAGIEELYDTVLYRNNTYKDAADKKAIAETFEHIFVSIYSLQALRSALPEDNNENKTKEKLGLILERGRPEYRIHIVIGEQVKAVSGYSYENWYKAQISQDDGIWIGNGITQQYQMKASKTTGEMHEDITPEFGYSLQKGKCVKIKLIRGRQEADDSEW